jgi:hypothetical protein
MNRTLVELSLCAACAEHTCKLIEYIHILVYVYRLCTVAIIDSEASPLIQKKMLKVFVSKLLTLPLQAEATEYCPTSCMLPPAECFDIYRMSQFASWLLPAAASVIQLPRQRANNLETNAQLSRSAASI